MSKGKKTGGRRPGSRNRRTIARREALTAAAVELRADLDAEAMPEPGAIAIPEPPFKGDAHALLRSIYVDSKWPMELRVDCAKSAIRFERPALVATHVSHSNSPSKAVLAALSIDQIKALLLEMDADVIAGQAIEGDPVVQSDEDSEG